MKSPIAQFPSNMILMVNNTSTPNASKTSKLSASFTEIFFLICKTDSFTARYS